MICIYRWINSAWNILAYKDFLYSLLKIPFIFGTADSQPLCRSWQVIRSAVYLRRKSINLKNETKKLIEQRR
jgi:hypothetical protein